MKHVAAGVVIALLLVIVCVQAACGPHEPREDAANDDVRAMRFVRHPNGLCFGIVRFSTYAMYEGVSITQVDSKACGR